MTLTGTPPPPVLDFTLFTNPGSIVPVSPLANDYLNDQMTLS